MRETEKRRRLRHGAEPEVDYGPTPGVADDSAPRDQSSRDPGQWPSDELAHSDVVKVEGATDHFDTPHHDASDHTDAFHLAFGHVLGPLGSFSEAFEHSFDALGNFLANLPEHPD